MKKLFKTSLLGINLSVSAFVLGDWCNQCGECDHSTEYCPMYRMNHRCTCCNQLGHFENECMGAVDAASSMGAVDAASSMGAVDAASSMGAVDAASMGAMDAASMGAAF